MPPHYWIGVIAADHAQHAVQTGVCAFSHGKPSSLAKLSEGDRIAYYAPKTGYLEGEPVQCFVALGTVIDATPFEHDWAGYRIWVCKAAYAELSAAPVRPLLEKLKFVTNPAKWGMAFRRSQFEITEQDFATIEAAMKDQDA